VSQPGVAPGPIPQPNDRLEQRIAALEQQIREINRKTLYSAKISGGDLTVQDGAEFSVLHELGGWLLHVGIGASGKYFLTIRRDDGTVALEIGTTGEGKQFVGVWDRAGHLVLSDDAASGQGLSRPWLNVPMLNTTAASLPTTTSAAWFTVASSGWIQKQQPFIEAQALLLSNGGGVGQARYAINGNQVGNVMPIASGAFGWTSLQTLAIPGDFAGYVRLELQLQLTNATGNVAGGIIATQRQT
jgi:hypothetical protein